MSGVTIGGRCDLRAGGGVVKSCSEVKPSSASDGRPFHGISSG